MISFSLSNLLLCLLSLSFYNFITGTKLCNNCKHFMDIGSSPIFARCALFPTTYDNAHLVLGTKSSPLNLHFCSSARDSESLCGEEGKMFKKKYKARKEKEKMETDE